MSLFRVILLITGIQLVIGGFTGFQIHGPYWATIVGGMLLGLYVSFGEKKS